MATAELQTEDPLVRRWERFLKDYYRAEINEAALAWPRLQGVQVDWWDLDKHDADLAQMLLTSPTQCILAAEIALRTLDLPLPTEEAPARAGPEAARDPRIRLTVRPVKLPDHARVEVRDLRSEHLGRFVAVHGLVKKVTEVRPKIEDAVFQCSRCTALIRQGQDEHLVLREPLECYEDQGGCGRTTSFRLITEPGKSRNGRGAETSDLVDTQKLEIQELPEGLRGGEQPQRLVSFAERDLCGRLSPGDRVVLNGVLRSHVRKQGGVKSTLLEIHLDIVSMEMEQQEYEEVEISAEEEEEIRRFSRDPELFDKMRASIAPDLYGLEMEKESLLLQLFGGLQKQLPSGLRLRGDIHILFVGDPGVAKSQLLRYTAKLAPRAIYTSGKSSSAAGLTAAAVKDEFGEGRWTLEAGALVLADKGIACIDEMDKMEKQDQSSMHEAMEQQSYHRDVELLLGDGRKVRIGEFVDGLMSARPEAVVQGVDCEILPSEGIVLPSVDIVSGESVAAPVARVSRHAAPESFVRIRFSNGRDVLVTPEHPVFVEADGGIAATEARRVAPGTWIPAPRALAVSSHVPLRPEPRADPREKEVRMPETVDVELGELLGLLASEGHSFAGSSHEVGFSNKDPRLLARAAALARGAFGIESTDHVNAAGTTTLRWVSTRLYRWFARNFPEIMRRARGKRIPAAVLAAPDPIVAAFLRGAFSGDGSVEPEALGFATASPGLAEDYADALLRLGIASRVFHDRGSDAWKVYVLGDGLPRFVDEVVSPEDPRRARAEALAGRSRRARRQHDVLPSGAAAELCLLQDLLGVPRTGRYRPHARKGHGVHVETVREELARLGARIETVRLALRDAVGIRPMREAIGWSQEVLARRIRTRRGAVGHAEGGGYDDERRLALERSARTAVEAALAEAEARMRALEDRLRLRWLRVVEVESVPNAEAVDSKWVYDVTVEPTHTFCSAGVVLHNTISVAKAGITATLQSRCAILGAANPKLGRFDEFAPLPDQINFPPALMSRFDLIFVLTDKPDATRDAALAQHLLDRHRGGAILEQLHHRPDSLLEREEADRALARASPTVEPNFLRKYVAYSKRTCYPVLTAEAQRRIMDYYVDLRRTATTQEGGGPIPLTARQLEAFVRLAEASARVRLSDVVAEADAERAIRIVEYYLRRLNRGEGGIMDVDVVASGVSHNQRDRLKTMKDIIRELTAGTDEGAALEDVVAEAERRGVPLEKARDALQRLKQMSQVYEPRGDTFRLT